MSGNPCQGPRAKRSARAATARPTWGCRKTAVNATPERIGGWSHGEPGRRRRWPGRGRGEGSDLAGRPPAPVHHGGRPGRGTGKRKGFFFQGGALSGLVGIQERGRGPVQPPDHPPEPDPVEPPRG